MFIELKKNLKAFVRQGVPNHLRSEVWHIFIQKQISDIRKVKGITYYENLCHLLPNSDVSNQHFINETKTFFKLILSLIA